MVKHLSKLELHFLASGLCSLATIVFVATVHPEMATLFGCVAFINFVLGLKNRKSQKK
jgi:hypothetical protein